MTEIRAGQPNPTEPPDHAADPDRARRPEHAHPQAPHVPAGAMAQAAAPQFSIVESIGGVRGVLESVIPFSVLSAVYGFTEDLRLSVICALVPAVLMTLWRLVARERLNQALSGVIGIGIGAFIATRTGNATDVFLPSIFKNAGFATVYLISILVRWPLLGVILGPLFGEGFAWREDRRRRSVYAKVTWIWVAMFVIRLAVQIPLYLSDQVVLLGTLNAFVLGLPLFGVTVWLSWLVMRAAPKLTPQPAEAVPAR